MNTLQFLGQLRARQLALRLHGEDQLIVDGGIGAYPELLAELKLRKAEIIHLLQAQKQPEMPLAPPLPYYPLSQQQKRLWIADRLSPGQNVYHIASIHRLQGPFEPDTFQQALQILIRRHECLRTVFPFIDGKAVQQILPDLDVLSVLNYSEAGAGVDGAEELAQEVQRWMFHLETGPLLRAEIRRLEASTCLLAICVHHIVADAWSIRLLVEEWLAVYEGLLSGNPYDVERYPYQYKDYAYLQNQQLERGQWREHEAFWRKKLQEKPLQALLLETDFPRPLQRRFQGSSLHYRFDDHTTKRLKALAQDQHTTLFTTLATAVALLLHRYTGDRDLVIGMTSAGRYHPEWQALAGFFVNALPLRLDIREGQTFQDLLAHVADEVLQALEHEAYPVDCLLEHGVGHSAPGRNPWFDVLVEFLDAQLHTDRIRTAQGLSLEPCPMDVRTSKFDLSFRFWEQEGALHWHLEYDTALFDTWRMEQLQKHFVCLLSEVLGHPAGLLTELDYLTPQERHDLLYTFNNTSTPVDTSRSLGQWLEQALQQHATATALRSGETHWTYVDLLERSGKIAAVLRSSHGVERGTVVGVMARRTPEVVAAIIGILRAEAAFLPIDPQCPIARMQAQLEIADVGLLLITSPEELFDLPQAFIGQVVLIDTLLDHPDVGGLAAGDGHDPAQLAYVIFTSGSTGQPKGVEIAQSNLLHYLLWAQAHYFSGQQGLDAALFTSLAFDLSLTSLFVTLLRGDTLHLYSETQPITKVLEAVFHPDSKIRAVKMTPSHVELLAFLGLRSTAVQHLILGGEALQEKHCSTLFHLNPQLRIYNEYGPTETTIGCTAALSTAGHTTLAIGKPAANTQIYLLDAYGQPVPVGTPGEMYIGGHGVGRGYRKRFAETAERFLPNPFAEGRLYKSGDLAKWMPGGVLLYLGRADAQIKINGYRIEPGDIEAALLDMGASQAVVLHTQDTAPAGQLQAYLVCPTPLGVNALRSGIARRLPAYMIPSAFYQLDHLPLNVNGKIDQEALLGTAAEYRLADTGHVPPEGALETWLHKILCDVLDLPTISTDINLFSIGLDSLKVASVFQQIEMEKPGQVQIHELFSNPTIRQMAALLSPETAETTPIKVQLIEF